MAKKPKQEVVQRKLLDRLGQCNFCLLPAECANCNNCQEHHEERKTACGYRRSKGLPIEMKKLTPEQLGMNADDPELVARFPGDYDNA